MHFNGKRPKTVGRLFGYAKNLLAGIGVVSIVAYGLNSISIFPEQRNEVRRIPSPNQEYEIVILRKELTSFTTPILELYVVPYNAEFKDDSDFFRFYTYQAVTLTDVEWVGNRKIIIYRGANSAIYHFEPSYTDPRDHTSGEEIERYRTIEIELVNKTH